MDKKNRYTVIMSTVYMTPIPVSAENVEDAIVKASKVVEDQSNKFGLSIQSEEGITGITEDSAPLMGGFAAIIDRKEGTVRFLKNGFMIDKVVQMAISSSITDVNGEDSLKEIDMENGIEYNDWRSVKKNSWSPPPLPPDEDSFDPYNPKSWKKPQ